MPDRYSGQNMPYQLLFTLNHPSGLPGRVVNVPCHGCNIMFTPSEISAFSTQNRRFGAFSGAEKRPPMALQKAREAVAEHRAAALVAAAVRAGPWGIRPRRLDGGATPKRGVSRPFASP